MKRSRYMYRTNIVQDAEAGGASLDLASLACDAAIELDNLILGRSEALDAVHRLATTISEVLSSTAQTSAQIAWLDPTTVVVMKRAIDDSIAPKTPVTTVPELVQEANKIKKRLIGLEGNTSSLKLQDMKDIEQMRAFCLALSKRASAQGQPLYDRKPDRPFRR